MDDVVQVRIVVLAHDCGDALMTSIAVDEPLQFALARDHDAAAGGTDALGCVTEPALISGPYVKRVDRMRCGQNQLPNRLRPKHHVGSGAPRFSARPLALRRTMAFAKPSHCLAILSGC